MSNHTPGRWFSNENYVFSDNEIIENNPTVVCRSATEYDACLIAAAPDLFNALQALVTKVGHDEWFVEWRQIADQAIAKAKGETE